MKTSIHPLNFIQLDIKVRSKEVNMGDVSILATNLGEAA